MSNTRYISTADTAKLIRKALRRSFPGQQFFVRSRTYSMGASIDVSWMDGPTEKEVGSVTQAYASAGFDGMIDLQFHYHAWLLPDGSALIASTCGTAGSGGTVSAFEVGTTPSPGGAGQLRRRLCAHQAGRQPRLRRALCRRLPREDRLGNPRDRRVGLVRRPPGPRPARLFPAGLSAR